MLFLHLQEKVPRHLEHENDERHPAEGQPSHGLVIPMRRQDRTHVRLSVLDSFLASIEAPYMKIIGKPYKGWAAISWFGNSHAPPGPYACLSVRYR